MRTTAEFIEHILDQLTAVGVVQTSKLYGGVLLKVNNKQLGLIVKNELYFKVKEVELQEKFESLDSEQLMYKKEDLEDLEDLQVARNWWSVPEETFEDKAVLVGLAHEVLLQGK